MPPFLATDTALTVAATARFWGTSPARLLGLHEGSLPALLTDIALANRLAEHDQQQPMTGRSTADPFSDIPDELRALT